LFVGGHQSTPSCHRPVPHTSSAVQSIRAGDDTEESGASTAGGPQQVAVVLCRGPDQLAVGGHHVDGHDVLRRPAPAAGVPSHPALQQEAADAHRRAVASVEEPAAGGQERIELIAALDRRTRRDDAAGLVVDDLLQAAEVDQQALLAHAPGCPAVPSRPHGDLPALRAGQPYARDNVLLARRR
jgi:hypothetical protein